MKTITYNPDTHRLVPVEPNNTALDWVDPGFGTRKKAWERILASFPQPEPVEVEPYLYEWILRRNGFTQHTKKLTDIADLSQWDILPLYTAPPDYEEIKRQLEEIKRQRDELVKALAELHRVNLNNYKHDPDDYENTTQCRMAIAALASVKGGAA